MPADHQNVSQKTDFFFKKNYTDWAAKSCLCVCTFPPPRFLRVPVLDETCQVQVIVYRLYALASKTLEASCQPSPLRVIAARVAFIDGVLRTTLVMAGLQNFWAVFSSSFSSSHSLPLINCQGGNCSHHVQDFGRCVPYSSGGHPRLLPFVFCAIGVFFVQKG